MTIRSLSFILLIITLCVQVIIEQEKSVLFREDFVTLDNWKPLLFPKIKKHSVYSIQKEGLHHYLKAESDASASAIAYKEAFNVYDYPRVKWRWKVSNVYKKADARKKTGDDYPLRVYVMFEYNPEKAATFEKLKYGIAKKKFGEYPPQSTLSYVWASREAAETFIVSPYADKAMVVIVQQGTRNVGTWQDQEINIVEDYHKAFGVKPPDRARIAIMNDSDNTGENAISFMEYLEVLH
jgi:hypothetical protein